MAGVQAGRLSIEIVAEVARLQQDMDKIKRAVKAASNDIASDARNAGTSLEQMGKSSEASSRRMNASVGSTRMGMMQLSYQLGDLSQQFALGVPWQRVWMQQSGQVLQAVQLLAGGTSKFANFLMGPWGIALTFATVVLTPLVGKLFETDEAAEKANAEIKDLSETFDFATISAKHLAEVNKLLAEANSEVERTTIGAANATRIKAEADRDAARAAIQRAIAEYQRIRADISDPANAVSGFGLAAGSLANRAEEIEKRVKELSEAEQGFSQVANRSAFNVGVLTAGLDDNGRAVEALRQRIDDLRQAYQRTGNKTFLDQALAIQEQINNLEKSGRTRRTPKTEAEKEIDRRTKETDRFIESLEQEIARIGLNEKAIRQLEIARALETAVTEQQRQSIIRLNAEREQAIALDERQKRLIETQKETKSIDERVQAVRREAQVLELVGWAREKSILQMEREAEISPILIRQNEALTRGETELADELQRQIDLLNEQFGLRIQMGDRMEQIAEWEKRYGTLRDFLIEVNKTPVEMKKAFESIKMNGLDALNDELVNAIVNFENLGDVATNVVRQIIAELLRLQIQKLIIAPLANAWGLALPGGGPTNLLSGTPFGGGRASGGSVKAGTSYLVGEEGPEVLTMGANGYITPNDRIANDNSKTVVEIVDTTGLFRFKVNSQIMEAAPVITEASAKTTASKMSWRQSRRVG